MTFTGKDRVLMAFNHQKGDRLPVFDVVNQPDIYVNHIGVDNYYPKGVPTVQLAKKIGMDAVMVHCTHYTCLIPPKDQWDGPDTFTDKFGIASKVTPASWPLGMTYNSITADENFLHLLQNTQVTDEDVAEVAAAVAEADDEIAVFGGVRSAFSFLFIALGIENLAMLMYDDPDLLVALIEAADDYWTKVGLKLLETGCTALYVANDLGMNERTLISPQQLREFFFPSMSKQIATWKEAGGKVIFHSCGNIDAVVDDIVAMGIDALNNLQEHAGMDIAKIKSLYQGKVTLIGNVDATNVLTSPDKTVIDGALKKVIDIAGYDGGLIVATDHSFHKGIPEENVLYFIDKAKELGTFK
jgi:uroporphyrinogen decarboxylase